MEQYRINDLERLTGVKAHTIRIWEKRYMLIQPSRTATNRRYYNSAQLKRLMNISTLLAQGHKISNLAVLTDEEISTQIEILHHSPGNDVLCAALIHDLTTAMLNFDEQIFEKVFTTATTHLGFYESMLQVFYPFLRKTGLLWRVEKANPVEEHFAVSIIRRKIISATDQLPLPKNSDKKFLLFLPPNEWHEIGLLFANYIIRSRNITTIYLGQSVPYSDINRISSAAQPQFLLLFYVSPKPKEQLEKEIISLSESNTDKTIYISGDRELFLGTNCFQNNVKYLKDVNSLLNIL